MKVVVNPAYPFLADFFCHLSNRFETEGTTIYEGRNVLKRFNVEGCELVVKSFKVPFFFNRIVYTLFRKSKARRSYEYAFEILKRGSDTPEPLGYIEEYKYGLLARSYSVSVYSKASDIREYMNEQQDDKDLLTGLGAFIAHLHQVGIYHIDLSPGNVLYWKEQNTFRFTLVDINRMKFKKVTVQDAVKNFSRLAISRRVLSIVTREYACIRGLDEVTFVRQANQYSDCVYRKYAFHLACKSWRKGGGSWFSQPYFLYALTDMFSRCPFFTKVIRDHFHEKRIGIYTSYILPFDFRKVFSESSQEN